MKKNSKRLMLLSATILSAILVYFMFFYQPTGFVKAKEDDSKLIYLNDDGKQVFGMQTIDDHTYVFDDKSGYLMIGFFNYKDHTYYANDEGQLQYGFMKIDQDAYFFQTDGKMLKHDIVMIQDDDVKTLAYFNKDGKRSAGAFKKGKDLYYFKENLLPAKNELVTFPFHDKKLIAYFNDKGKAIHGIKKIKDSTYYFDSNYCMVKNKLVTYTKDKHIYTSYFNKEGKMTYGLQSVNNEYYYFKKDGNMAHDHLQDITLHKQKQTSYFSSNGKMAYGLVNIGDHYYYFNRQGAMVKNQKVTYVQNRVKKTSYFDEEGRLDPSTTKVHVPKPVVAKPVTNAKVERMRKKVNSIINSYNGDISVYYKDLNSGATFYLNPQTMYPASIIKVPVMVAAFQEIEKGHFTYNSISKHMYNMITVSDNTGMNMIIRKIGKGDGLKGAKIVNSYMRSFGLHQTVLHHGYRPGDGYFTDDHPNVSSALDIGTLFANIYYGNCANGANTSKMINLLAGCVDDRGIQQGLPSHVTYAHKTGYAYEYYIDGGIVFAKGSPYVLTIFSNHTSHNKSMMYDVSSYIYQEVMKQ